MSCVREEDGFWEPKKVKGPPFARIAGPMSMHANIIIWENPNVCTWMGPGAALEQYYYPCHRLSIQSMYIFFATGFHPFRSPDGGLRGFCVSLV